ncbi:MAG: hypothetical protein COA69_07295 [Robiginitomaculum sp.]|nr:MAG: hypothetical protein COA69_07295 [Robiginitomaculum sp.]
MTHKQAHRRYMKLSAALMVLYVVGILGLSLAEKHTNIPRVALYGLTGFPIAAIFGWMWGLWRYVNEIDEFLRAIQIKSIMYGLTIVMGVSTGWGLLEFYSEVPRLPIFYVVPIFSGAYGIAHIIISRREGGVCS